MISGKTTLMNLITALDRLTSGSLAYPGRDYATMSDRQKIHMRRNQAKVSEFLFRTIRLLRRTARGDFRARRRGAGGMPVLIRLAASNLLHKE